MPGSIQEFEGETKMERRSFISGAAAAVATALTAKEVIFPTTASAQTAGQVLMPSIWSRHVQ